MTAAEIVDDLRSRGAENIKRILLRHGAKEPIYGVKIEELKKIQKKVKRDYQLALDLYDTGISDAMYLAGLIADDEKMTKKDLERWVKKASWHMISEYTVPGVAAASKHGHELALKWIDSPQDLIATSGWSTLSLLAATRPDDELDLAELKALLKRVEKEIHKSPNYVRYVMNGFVISIGGYVAPLTDLALKTADKIGKVEVDMGETSCQVHDARQYIEKMRKRGVIGKKKKSTKC
jgi:3-methyladenine DNA glycosylase AlkD